MCSEDFTHGHPSEIWQRKLAGARWFYSVGSISVLSFSGNSDKSSVKSPSFISTISFLYFISVSFFSNKNIILYLIEANVSILFGIKVIGKLNELLDS